MDPWKVAPDERLKHDSQFSTLTQGTHISGEQARNFFLQSKLPPAVLGQIWALADLTSDGMMDRKEFSIAMTLIKRKLQGCMLPTALPPSMLVEPSHSGTLPHGMPGGATAALNMTAMSSATLPGRLPAQAANFSQAAPVSPARTADNTDWAVPHASRLNYNQLFNREDRKHVGYLTGLDAKQLLLSTGIPQNLLAQIWSLADVDSDGKLTSEEFALAMFLIDMVKMGQPLPMTLPPNFIPPSMRARSRSNSAAASSLPTAPASRPIDSFGDLIPGGFGGSAMPLVADSQVLEETPSLTPLTLEDKRRENFAKGNAELERRRAELREQQRKEEEARLAKERAELEKKEAIKREQEKKRLVEQERMLERQRQMEAEREEQRRKALEAKESARREMERQRQQEWERQRKQALLAEKKRHEEAVQLLERQVNNLKYEIETMDNKKNELMARIAEGKENVAKNTGYIDDMRSTRDGLVSAVSLHQTSKNEQEKLLTRLTGECNQVKQSLQARQAANPISDNFKQHQHLHTAKKQQVDALRNTLQELDTNKTSLNAEVSLTRESLDKLKESVTQLQQSNSNSRAQVQSKKSEWEAEKTRKADEKTRAERELRLKEEEEKQKQLEEEKRRKIEEEKKKEENKWSVFEGLDFSAPTATTSVPGNQASFGTSWQTSSTTDAPGKVAASDSLWGDVPQANSSVDPFADSSWGTSAESSSNAWGKSVDFTSSTNTNPTDSGGKSLWETTNTSQTLASSQSTSLFGGATDPFTSSSKSAAPLLQPPPKTPTKKETTFGAAAPTTQSAASALPAASAANESGQSRTRKVEIYEVLYDFEGRSTDELTIGEGEKVKVYPDEQESAEPGWISGWKGDKVGIFPANYVQKLRDVYEPVTTNDAAKRSGTGESSGMARSESAFDEVRSSPTPGDGSPAPDGLRAKALYQWRAKKDNHLSFDKGAEIKVLMQQDLWWHGSLANGQEGWFPKSYVEPIEKPTVTVQAPPKVEPLAPSSRLYDQVPTIQSPEDTAEKQASLDSSRFYDQVPGASPTSDSPSKTQAERYLAMHNYQSDVSGDLNFNAGDLIIVTSKDGEWWTGSLDGRTGIFPANYVTQSGEETSTLESVQTNNAPPSLPSRQTTSNVEPLPLVSSGPTLTKKHPRAAPRTPLLTSPTKAPSFSPSPTPVGAASSSGPAVKEIGRVIAAYEATGQEQLSLKPNQLIHIKKKSPSGWWEGELMAKGQKKQIGWFPKDYIKLLPSTGNKTGDRASTPASELMDSSRSQEAAPPAASVQPVTTTTPDPAPAVAAVPVAAPVHQGKVQASYPYTAQNDDELSFQEGDIIAVVNKDDPDWWTGQLGGTTGVFPSNYVQHYTEPLSEEEKKRQQAITELIDTEEAYVNDMCVAIEAFYEPLRESKSIPESELEAIFVNWKELIHCNRKLVNAFKVRQRSYGQDEPINIVGDILVENFPNMTPYIRFCSRQLYAAQLLQRRVETDNDARQFISKCQQDERVHGMPLSSYILKPMQRITKYPLLVNRIMSHTSRNHPDYPHIEDASSKAQDLVNQVNEGVREEDNSDKLEWVQNHVSCEGLPEHITFNSPTNALGQRKFIYSGVLTKLRSGRELYAFLFNDFLLFTTPVSSNSVEKVFQLDSKGILFKMYKTPLFLNEMSVREPTNLEKPDTDNVCFQICHIENVLDIKCTTTTERNAWLKRLTTASEEALSMERVKRERAQSSLASPVSKRLGRLLVFVMEGRSLLASDASGKSDPYCEVTMGSILHKTKVIPNTLNPKWNSNMQFPIKSVEDDVLCFTVFDQDRFSPNDFLGRTELRVKDILKETKEKRGPILKYVRLQEVNTGDIVVKLDLQIYRSLTPVPSQRARR